MFCGHRQQLQRRLRASDSGRGRLRAASPSAPDSKAAPDDTAEAIQQAARQLPPRDRAADRVLPHRAGTLVPIHGDRIGERSASPRSSAALEQAACVIIRKSSARDRGMERAGAASSPRRSHLLGEHVQPGVTTAELDRARGGVHPRARGGVPTFEGLPRLSRGDLHVAELDGRARHPRQPTGSRRATSCRSTSASRSTGSSAD